MFNSDQAFKFDVVLENPVTPDPLCVLEIIFVAFLDQSIDIWSFGCLVYKLFIGYPLFPIFSSTWKCVDKCHLLSIIDQLRSLLEHIFSQWPCSNKYFHSDGQLFNLLVSETKILLIKSPSLET